MYNAIVCYYVNEKNYYEIIDGYRRYLVMKKLKEIAEREENHLPVVIIDKPIVDRIASTIRHNRARGRSYGRNYSKVSRISSKWSMDYITNLGMDKDELLRLKQISGLVSLFAKEDFSEAWEEI